MAEKQEEIVEQKQEIIQKQKIKAINAQAEQLQSFNNNKKREMAEIRETGKQNRRSFILSLISIICAGISLLITILVLFL